MPDFEDYYEILGVGSKATPDEINKAWKDKFWILSPDRMNGAPETAKKRAEEELKKVNNAYDTLKDPQKRQDYDKQWHQIKDKPKPVVDPPNIRFNNVNPKEVKTGSFVIRNLGGPYNKINISNPNTWVKVIRWYSLSDSDELPLQVEIEAVGDDFGNNYSEQIKVSLDDEETSVRIDLQTRPQSAQAPSYGYAPTNGNLPANNSGNKNKKHTGLLVSAGTLGIIVVILGIIFLKSNSPKSPPSSSGSQTTLKTQSSLLSSTPNLNQLPAVTPTSITSKTLTNLTSTSSTGKIVFASTRDGNSEIYVMNSDGSGQTRLTFNSADDITPVWSPDRTKIAFVSDRAGQPDIYDIYVMNSDGTNPIRLTTAGGANPAWSPNGLQIAFASNRDGRFQIYTMNTNGSNQKKLTNAASSSSPAWSPDGGKIAFVYDSTVVAPGTSGTSNPQICVMNRDGSNIVQLLYPSAQNYSPIWSPDGTKIIFVSSGTGPNYAHHIYIMDNNGENMHLWVTSNNEDTSPCWSPNGTKMVFVSSRAGLPEIYTMNADGSNQIRLTDRTSGIDFSKPQPGGLMIGDFSPNW